MTRLRHQNPPSKGRDPATVRQVPDSARPIKYVSTAQKVQRAKELADEEKARIKQVKLVQEYQRLKDHTQKIRRKERSGERLTFWEEATLQRWKEVRAELMAK